MSTEVLEAVSRQPYLDARLQQAQKMEIMGKLASGVIHDFNNLVTVMAGYSAILLEHFAHDDPLHEVAQELQKVGERAAALSRQLMAFSRQEATTTRLLHLNSIVNNIGKMLRRLIGEDIELVTVLDQALGLVQADPGHIEQLILNLAVNARDAMPMGGKLTITTANIHGGARGAYGNAPGPAGAYVKLVVSDTGCGMDAVTRTRLFEPFYTTKGPGQGTGLGMTIVQEIVAASGGTIHIESVPALGTTVEIYLPRAERVDQDAAVFSAPDESPRGTETILLVEDEETVRTALQYMLQLHGYTVLAAPDGKAAILLAARYNGAIDLLLTDVVMPHMSGPELVQCLLPVRPGMKILYMSGYAKQTYLPQNVRECSVSFLSKPFTPEEFTHRIRRVLDASRSTSPAHTHAG